MKTLPVIVNGSPAAVVLDSPLQRFRLTPHELAVVQRARMVLINHCAHEFGVVTPLGPSVRDLARSDVAAEASARSRLYGITDKDAARKYGYGIPPMGQPSDAESPPVDPRLPLVLFGPSRQALPNSSASGANRLTDLRKSVPADGCSGEADRRLFVDPDLSPYGLAHDVWIRNQQQLQRSRVWREVVNDWAACLREAGYHVTDPVSDQGDIRNVWNERLRRGGEGPDFGESALAIADVNCKRQVQLVARLNMEATRLDSVSALQTRVELDADRQRLDRQVALARGVLARHG